MNPSTITIPSSSKWIHWYHAILVKTTSWKWLHAGNTGHFKIFTISSLIENNSFDKGLEIGDVLEYARVSILGTVVQNILKPNMVSMVSLSKLQDWNSCASFRWSPDFHRSCNHWGTCRRPPFFGSHSLRNRAFKAALSFVGRNMSEHPLWNSINVLRQQKASQMNLFRCIISDYHLCIQSL